MLASKLMAALSGGAEEKLYVDDVFSAFTYTGNGASRVINNGIDLAGKGGLVWCKSRSGAENNGLFDTVRGGNSVLVSNTTNGALAPSAPITFTNNGYSHSGNGTGNSTDTTYVSWTFRKAPKFFDVVTYTGNGVAGRQIPHSLGVAPGMIILKRTNTALDWMVYHMALGATKNLKLNTTAAEQVASYPWNSAEPTSSVFTVNNTGYDNANGDTYVAYLFAHDTSVDGIIQCGSITSGQTELNLGWEPQYVLYKRIDSKGDWHVEDTMRGFTIGTYRNFNGLSPNTSGAEQTGGPYNLLFGVTSTGASLMSGFSGTYIYLAIRRPNKPPTTGTEVYNAIARTGTGAAATVTGVGFAPDLVKSHCRVSGYVEPAFFDRLRGANIELVTSATSAENLGARTDLITAYGVDGISLGADASRQTVNASGATYINHFFRRAPGFMDVVCYTGTGGVLTLNHSLNATPELIIFKNRSTATNWLTYHSFGVSSFLRHLLNGDSGTASFNYGSGAGFNNQPTATQIGLDANATTNAGSTNCVAYLFATLPGISKVGSYTGNGTTQTINCGFTTGARFILIKRTDSTGDWYVWDSVRGIVAGNDPHLSLNTTVAEITTDDSVDPDVSGFIVNQVAATNINVSGGQYIFLAIA